MTKNIVLVHGAWHTGACWDAVKQILTEKGYTVYCPTYPGNEPENPQEVSPSDYSTWLQDVVSGIPGKVIVVGHSAAGLILTDALPAVKDKVELAVYYNAFIPPDGMSRFDCEPNAAAMRAGAEARGDGRLPLDPDFARKRLLHLADEETFQRLCRGYIVPQPIALFDFKVHTKRFVDSGIPCGLLHCTDDANAAPNQYLNMFRVFGRGTIVEIPGEHEQFFSDPVAWTNGLLQLIE